MYVDVSSVYTKKLQFFNSIWEANASKINLKNWHKHPWSGDDLWFKNELYKDLDT